MAVTINGDGTINNLKNISYENLTVTTGATLPAATSVGNVSSTELGYVDGVTSAIQTQISARKALTAYGYTIVGGTSTTSTGFIDIVTLTITPASTSSKFLISSALSAYVNVSNYRFATQLVRDSTVLQIMYASSPGAQQNSIPHTYLDSPGTTASIVYRLQYRCVDGGTTYVVNGGASLNIVEFAS